MSGGSFSSRLEETRDLMKDLALPPGYHLGQDSEGSFLVVQEDTSEIFAVDGTEEDLPRIVVDLWRQYIAHAPPASVCRMVQNVLAVDAILSWEGELVRRRESYECSLSRSEGAFSVSACAPDPVSAALRARRALLDSLEEPRNAAPVPQEE